MTAATTPAADLGALHVVPRSGPSSSRAGSGGATNEETEAEALIAILADALESIAAETTDPSARNIAVEALATFHGR